jgi:hypothetical protein
MQPDFVQHAWKIHHAARHFLWAFWVDWHDRMNRIGSVVKQQVTGCSRQMDEDGPEAVVA